MRGSGTDWWCPRSRLRARCWLARAWSPAAFSACWTWIPDFIRKEWLPSGSTRASGSPARRSRMPSSTKCCGGRARFRVFEPPVSRTSCRSAAIGHGRSPAKDRFIRGTSTPRRSCASSAMDTSRRSGSVCRPEGDSPRADRASSEPVAIVNETLARTLWPGQDAIGQVVTQDGGRRVVGVVADVRHEALEKPGGSEMYRPMRQTADYSAMNLVVRTALPPDRLVVADPGGAQANRFEPARPRVHTAADTGREGGITAALPGPAAGRICGVRARPGVGRDICRDLAFGESADAGNRNTNGAGSLRRQCRAHILLQTLSLAAVGLALGIAASLALSGALESLLFGVTPGDPATFIGIGVLLLGVAALAGYIPARRASRIDPMAALRAS